MASALATCRRGISACSLSGICLKPAGPQMAKPNDRFEPNRGNSAQPSKRNFGVARTGKFSHERKTVCRRYHQRFQLSARGYVKRLLPDLEDLTDTLPTLKSGEALLIGDSVVMPVLVQIDRCESTPSSTDIPYFERWKKTWKDVKVDAIIFDWRNNLRLDRYLYPSWSFRRAHEQTSFSF
jgi:hypothetical protein